MSDLQTSNGIEVSVGSKFRIDHPMWDGDKVYRITGIRESQTGLVFSCKDGEVHESICIILC